ncbi:hypothetical protein N7488_000215 [Penicillium malachiteum]|nr:hypothetical protein N7488_000215 [Penicillium malachiteum]
MWSQTGPIDFRGQKLADFLRGVAGKVNVFDGYHSFDNFRREYSENFGHPPYVSPSQKERWEDGAVVSEEVRETAMGKIDIFKSWVEQQLFNASDVATLKTEYAPIITSLVGPKESDLTLLDIAEGTLQSAGWQSNILTGRYILHVGDNIRNAQSAVERKL